MTLVRHGQASRRHRCVPPLGLGRSLPIVPGLTARRQAPQFEAVFLGRRPVVTYAADQVFKENEIVTVASDFSLAHYVWFKFAPCAIGTVSHECDSIWLIQHPLDRQGT
jgi:hypothetical protein